MRPAGRVPNRRHGPSNVGRNIERQWRAEVHDAKGVLRTLEEAAKHVHRINQLREIFAASSEASCSIPANSTAASYFVSFC